MGKSADEMMTDTTSRIQSDIRRTESEMGETIHEIQDRLSPAHLKEEAKKRVMEAFERTRAKIADAARKNPGIPAAAAVAAAAALILLGRRRKAARKPAPSFPPAAFAEERAGAAGELSQQTAIVAGSEGMGKVAGIGVLGITLGAVLGAFLPTARAEAEVYEGVVEAIRESGTRFGDILFPPTQPPASAHGGAIEETGPVFK